MVHRAVPRQRLQQHRRLRHRELPINLGLLRRQQGVEKSAHVSFGVAQHLEQESVIYQTVVLVVLVILHDVLQGEPRVLRIDQPARDAGR